MGQKILTLLAVCHITLVICCLDETYEKLTIDKLGSYIRNYRFGEAEAVLSTNKIQSEEIITDLISEHQFNPLLSFADYTSDLPTSIQIIKKVYRSNEDMECSIKYVRNLRRIIRSLYKIFYQYNTPWQVKAEVDNLLKVYKQSMTNHAKQIIEKCAQTKICLDSKIQYIADVTYTFDKAIFTDLIHDIISDLYGLVPTKILLGYVDNMSTLEQKIIGFQHLYNKLTRKERMSSVMANFVTFINKIIKDPLYSKVDKLLQETINMADLYLPTSLKYAILSPRVCILNVHFNESFYAYYQYEKSYSARPVLSWIPTKTEGLANATANYWVLTQDNSNTTFLIKSSAYDEYLYVGADYDKERRRIVTGPDGATTNAGKWYLEPTCDYEYVYIKSYNGEYVYPAEGLNFDKDRRRVFTWIPSKETFDEGRFKIFPC